MSELILHHYAMSPFSQKLRSMFGYTDMAWQSVVIKEMPPRPQLELLTGGYRKVPVGQIGADIFCDTRTIATEIARLSGKPELALENCDADQQVYVARVDLEIFFAVLFTSGTLTMLRKMKQGLSLAGVGRFFIDRIQIGRKASVPKIGMKQAKEMLREHLADAESRLSNDFLFGEQPNHADFSAYHSLWFSRDLAEAPHVSGFPKVSAWMDRIRALGEGKRSEITAEAAIAVAKNAVPRDIDDAYKNDPQIGQQVRIGPADYARDNTQGVLVGSTPTQWILARELPEVGTVHVHFPKQGYKLRAC